MTRIYTTSASIKCKTCGKEFLSFKSDKRVFCSLQCYWKSMDGFKGRPISEDTKKKIGIANAIALKGKKMLPHVRQILAESRKKQIGENHPLWAGGIKKGTRGYVYIYSPHHPYKKIDNYVAEHRLIIEKAIGRFLSSSEVVHHINKITSDNRLENLMAFSNNGNHMKYEKGLMVNSKNIIFDGRERYV